MENKFDNQEYNQGQQDLSVFQEEILDQENFQLQIENQNKSNIQKLQEETVYSVKKLEDLNFLDKKQISEKLSVLQKISSEKFEEKNKNQISYNNKKNQEVFYNNNNENQNQKNQNNNSNFNVQISLIDIISQSFQNLESEEENRNNQENQIEKIEFYLKGFLKQQLEVQKLSLFFQNVSENQQNIQSIWEVVNAFLGKCKENSVEINRFLIEEILLAQGKYKAQIQVQKIKISFLSNQAMFEAQEGDFFQFLGKNCEIFDKNRGFQGLSIENQDKCDYFQEMREKYLKSFLDLLSVLGDFRGNYKNQEKFGIKLDFERSKLFEEICLEDLQFIIKEIISFQKGMVLFGGSYGFEKQMWKLGEILVQLVGNQKILDFEYNFINLSENYKNYRQLNRLIGAPYKHRELSLGQCKFCLNQYLPKLLFHKSLALEIVQQFIQKRKNQVIQQLLIQKKMEKIFRAEIGKIEIPEICLMGEGFQSFFGEENQKQKMEENIDIYQQSQCIDV
ncbi:hypothetical protein PPERSA_08143 [Pseudocohnilembus persalinus]|uniref:Uncharacterized protein n=1 Tax=Pseudocohnilembus persalinus TaxID=266149 RepID=A0A0V0QM14_PSEPJ|nr:hypothetical protein PPERSA_08143 [Pseudocohnilembus persalinus]|eukprot:KRX03401.1 hypothetical protein PPERSA_08143 [Pseudocohnilembus persalinus]